MKYRITKASADGTFTVGDEIIFYRDGSIGCKQAGGWIDAEFADDAINGAEYVEIVDAKTESAIDAAWADWHGGGDIPVVSTPFRHGFLFGIAHIESKLMEAL